MCFETDIFLRAPSSYTSQSSALTCTALRSDLCLTLMQKASSDASLWPFAHSLCCSLNNSSSSHPSWATFLTHRWYHFDLLINSMRDFSLNFVGNFEISFPHCHFQMSWNLQSSSSQIHYFSHRWLFYSLEWRLRSCFSSYFIKPTECSIHLSEQIKHSAAGYSTSLLLGRILWS